MIYKPRLPEHNNNVSHTHPFREFLVLCTGLSAIVVISFWVIGFFVDRAVSYISPEIEAVIFSSFSPGASTETEADDPKQKKLQQMVDELQECVPIPYPIKVHLVDSAKANAMAFPGGRIIVLSGLLEKVSSQNGLSFILAHELAHYKNRDHLRSMGRAIVFTALSSLLTGADSGLTQLFAPTLSLSQAHYSQDRESLADMKALELLNCRYNHVGGATDFFEAMRESDKEGNLLLGHYFASHPEADARIEALYQQMEQKKYDMWEVRPLPPVLSTSTAKQEAKNNPDR